LVVDERVVEKNLREPGDGTRAFTHYLGAEIVGKNSAGFAQPREPRLSHPLMLRARQRMQSIAECCTWVAGFSLLNIRPRVSVRHGVVEAQAELMAPYVRGTS